jgi:quinohemoprotein amine dehydrogenase
LGKELVKARYGSCGTHPLAASFFGFCLTLLLPVSSAIPAFAQDNTSDAVKTSTPSKETADEGIPVRNALVVEKCSGCHKQDEKGNLSRISWIRTTPEGWEEAMKRMIRLHGLTVTPDQAKKILRYLSDSHGLAPEEAKPIAYIAEQRLIDEKAPNEDIAHACKACHALGRPLSWRRSADDWKLLVNMHIAFFPNVQSTAFLYPPRRGDAPPPAPGSDQRPPVEQAVAYFVKNGPLHSPEWADWQATMRDPKLDGRWLIYGTQPGKGRFYGEMQISTAAEDKINTTSRVTFVRDGNTLTSTGSSITYTGYAWRGKSKAKLSSTGIDAPSSVREVMMISRDQSRMEGRWFWGTYDEFGLDVTMRRAVDGITVLGTNIPSLKAGTNNAEVRIYGDNFPQAVVPNDIDLGSGVTITKVVNAKPNVITVTVEVAQNAIPGKRDVAVKHSLAPAAFAIYDHIDYLKVSPQTALAHLGGDEHAKGYWQFEAIGYASGPDGKPDTADDIELGPIPAQWKMEEFIASYGDDDTEFVGKLDADTGFFTPGKDGPNPKRKSSRNNYGDVWVVATAKPSGVDAPLVARSYLIVAVPQYIHWEQPEVTE